MSDRDGPDYDADEQVEAVDEFDMQPHSKPNMPSRVGRLVERATYTDVAGFAGFALTLSSLYYRFAPSGNGLNAPKHSFFEALYFSVVTFSTLGYGDIAPEGFGRVVSLLLVLSGLILTALFIGKVASERQSALLTLLHTSDVQRRISAFTRDFVNLRQEAAANANAASETELIKIYRSAHKSAVALNKYLSFNAYQAGIAEFGNASALSALYDELWRVFRVCMKRFRESADDQSPAIMTASFSTAAVISSTMALMRRFHQSQKPARSVLGHLYLEVLLKGRSEPKEVKSSVWAKSARLRTEMAWLLEEGRVWRDTGYHPLQIQRVLNVFPVGPKSEWESSIHKRIAGRLNISNSVAAKCISHLVKVGNLPKKTVAAKRQRKSLPEHPS